MAGPIRKIISILLIPAILLSNSAFAEISFDNNTANIIPYFISDLLDESKGDIDKLTREVTPVNGRTVKDRKAEFGRAWVRGCAQMLAAKWAAKAEEFGGKASLEDSERELIRQIREWSRKKKIPRYRNDRLIEAIHEQFALRRQADGPAPAATEEAPARRSVKGGLSEKFRRLVLERTHEGDYDEALRKLGIHPEQLADADIETLSSAIGIEHYPYEMGTCSLGDRIRWGFVLNRGPLGEERIILGRTDIEGLKILTNRQIEGLIARYRAGIAAHNDMYPYLKGGMRLISEYGYLLEDGNIDLKELCGRYTKDLGPIADPGKSLAHLTRLAKEASGGFYTAVRISGEEYRDLGILISVIRDIAEERGIELPRSDILPTELQKLRTDIARAVSMAQGGNPSGWDRIAARYSAYLENLSTFTTYISMWLHFIRLVKGMPDVSMERLNRWAFLACGPSIALRSMKKLEKQLSQAGLDLNGMVACEYDFSPAMLDAGKKALADSGLSTIQKEMDVLSEPLPHQDGDLTCVQTGIFGTIGDTASGLKKKAHLLNEANRVLEEGGFLILSCKNKPFPDELRRALEEDFGFRVLTDRDETLELPSKALRLLAGDDEARRARLRYHLQGSSYLVARKVGPAKAAKEVPLERLTYDDSIEAQDRGREERRDAIQTPPVTVDLTGLDFGRVEPDELPRPSTLTRIAREEILARHGRFEEILYVLYMLKGLLKPRERSLIEDARRQWYSPKTEAGLLATLVQDAMSVYNAYRSSNITARQISEADSYQDTPVAIMLKAVHGASNLARKILDMEDSLAEGRSVRFSDLESVCLAYIPPEDRVLLAALESTGGDVKAASQLLEGENEGEEGALASGGYQSRFYSRMRESKAFKSEVGRIRREAEEKSKGITDDDLVLLAALESTGGDVKAASQFLEEENRGKEGALRWGGYQKRFISRMSESTAFKNEVERIRREAEEKSKQLTDDDLVLLAALESSGGDVKAASQFLERENSGEEGAVTWHGYYQRVHSRMSESTAFKDEVERIRREAEEKSKQLTDDDLVLLAALESSGGDVKAASQFLEEENRGKEGALRWGGYQSRFKSRMSESKAFKNEVGRIRRETAAQKAPARRSVKGVEAVLAEVVSISREIATHQLFTSELEMGNIAVVMKKGVLEASTAGKETVIREKVAQGYRSAMASIKNMTGREPEMVTSPDELKAAVERLVKEKLRVVVIEDGSLTTGLEAENKTIEGARAGVDYCVIGAGAKELGERALQLFMVKVLVRMAVAALDGRSELFKLLYRMAAGENVDEKYLEKVVAVIDGEEEPPKLWSICIVPRAVQFGPDDIRNASDLQKLFRLAA